MSQQKVYKEEKTDNVSMLPGDPQGSPDDCFTKNSSLNIKRPNKKSSSQPTLVFIDDGFLARLSKYYGGGKYLKFDKVLFSKNLAIKQGLDCQHIFYYTSPPFQSNKPTIEEARRYRNHENFVNSLSQNGMLSVREGRCQRLKIGDKFVYKQKAVDSLAIIDMMSVPIDYPIIKTILLIASDSDFVPVVEKLKKAGINVILYIYYVKKRDTGLSRSNYLMRAVSRYVKLTKQDFDNAPLVKSATKDENVP